MNIDPTHIPNPLDISSLLLSIPILIALIYVFFKTAPPDRGWGSPHDANKRVRPAALRPEYTLKPLALRMGDKAVNPQTKSPLFSQLPSEIRQMVWEAALTRYSNVKTGKYAGNVRYCRPERKGAPRIDTQLLLTCRVVYLEAYHVPITINSVLDFEGDHHDIPPTVSRAAETINKFALWHFCSVRSYDITLQQRFLEQSWLSPKAFMLRADEASAPAILRDMRRYWKPSANFTWPASREEDDFVTVQGINTSKRLQHLTVRMNRTDWWTWTEGPGSVSEARLGLDPGVGAGTVDERCTEARMLELAEERRKGVWQGFTQRDCWGKDIGNFKNLRTFDLILETFAAKKEQLERVVECARTWTFPRDRDHELRFESAVSANWVGAGGYNYEHQVPWLTRSGVVQGREGKSDVVVDPHRFEVRVVRFVVQRVYVD